VARDAVVALGNPLMGDEGVGPAILDLLRDDPRLPSSVDLIDTSGFILTALHALKGRRKVVFVDCAFMGETPGALRRFLPSQARSEKSLPGLSLHEGDLLKMLETARSLDATAEEVVIYGIEPARVGPRQGLSPELCGNLEKYAESVLDEFLKEEPKS